MELSCDNGVKTKFASSDFVEILISNAAITLITFVTTYLCETGRSVVTVTQRKYRSKIVEIEMRVAVSTLIQRFEKIYGHQQAHPLH